MQLCPWFLALASSIAVLGLKRVCSRKGCPWSWPRIFLCPWPWPRALCPRLHLCSEHVRNVIQYTKNRPTAGGFAPRLPKPLAAGGSAPRPPSVLRLRYTTFLNTSPKLVICTFQLLLKALSLCKILLKCQQATISNIPSYDNFAPQKVPLLKIFDDFIACDLWFGPPYQSKILATPINWRLPEKLF